MANRSATLTVVYGQSRTLMNFGDVFPYEDREVYCAKVTPELDSGIQYLHFKEFSFSANQIILPGSIVVQLQSNVDYVLEIIDPVFVPQNGSINPAIRNEASTVRIQMFLKTNTICRYFGAASCPWKYAKLAISHMLTDAGYDFNQTDVGLVQQPRQIPATDELLSSFLGNISNAKLSMLLVLEPNIGLIIEYDSIRIAAKCLPTVPRCLAHLAFFRLKEEMNDQKKSLLRRFLAASANSGIAVDLVDQLGLRTSSHLLIRPGYFAKIGLNWAAIARFEFISRLFANCSLAFSRMFKNLNESTLGSQFWTPLLNAAILSLNSANLEIVTEWHTKHFLPHCNERKVDYAILCHCLPAQDGELHLSDLFPLLLVEYGLETVAIRDQLKDFSKMLSNAISNSRSGKRLARKISSTLAESKFESTA